MKQDIRTLVDALRRLSPVVTNVPVDVRCVLIQRYLEASIRNCRLGLAGFLVVIFGLAREVPLPTQLVAFLVSAVLLLVRLQMGSRLLRELDPADPKSNVWHDALALVAAVCWSLAPLVFDPWLSPLNLFALIYVCFVVLAVLSISYLSALPASVALVLCSLLPLMAYLLLQGTPVFGWLAAGTLICVGALMVRVRDSHRLLLQALTAERENAVLVKELLGYRQQLETENALLGTSLRDASDAASRDPLTGLFNRRYLASYAQPLGDVVDGHREAITVCMVDIDHFKRINDRHGHAAGDQVLQTVAALLGTRLRDADCLARFGGEEFVVVLRRCDINRARRVVEALRHNIASAEVETDAGIVAVTVSLGVAQWGAGEDFDAVMQRADRALYRAKQSGRDRLEIDVDDALKLLGAPIDSTFPGQLH